MIGDEGVCETDGKDVFEVASFECPGDIAFLERMFSAMGRVANGSRIRYPGQWRTHLCVWVDGDGRWLGSLPGWYYVNLCCFLILFPFASSCLHSFVSIDRWTQLARKGIVAVGGH
ncbi:uncharacterized protein BJX67DRAFT_47467 [Aspergillus lucknowensis]|uniref:Uncharacterized protein n=1 Tax=Aspergillus lucknowensis TaxID=176173 RepID=A0ABR4LZ53_9EURO